MIQGGIYHEMQCMRKGTEGRTDVLSVRGKRRLCGAGFAEPLSEEAERLAAGTRHDRRSAALCAAGLLPHFLSHQGEALCHRPCILGACQRPRLFHHHPGQHEGQRGHREQRRHALASAEAQQRGGDRHFRHEL